MGFPAQSSKHVQNPSTQQHDQAHDNTHIATSVVVHSSAAVMIPTKFIYVRKGVISFKLLGHSQWKEVRKEVEAETQAGNEAQTREGCCLVAHRFMLDLLWYPA